MTFTESLTSTAVATLNRGGAALRRAGITSPDLGQRTLVDAAIRRAELDDFGDWPVDELLPRLLESYEQEAKLSTVGRITVREMLVSLLENLLYIENERSTSIGIDDEEIVAPVFIVSLPRTGTTLLHGVIAQDAATRVPLTWEVMFPAGYEESEQQKQRARRRTSSRLAWANRLAPDFKRIHEISADLPQECIAIMAQGLASIQFHTTHNLPSYQDWFENHGQDLGYGIHQRILQHLQRRRGTKRWALKAPGHLFGLDALLRRYPDARIIQTHRDPVRAMGSIASHACVLRRAFSDVVEPRLVAADWCGRWADALDRSLEIREAAGPDRFHDVRFDDLMTAPLQTVERIYDFLGWSFTNQARDAMEAFLKARKRGRSGVHKYELTDYGLDHGDLSRRFAEYCEMFDIAVGKRRNG